MSFPDGSYYHGYFDQGKRCGNGLSFYANKDRFSGQWKDGKKHGKGTYIFDHNNSKFKGEWEHGNITTGDWELSNGDAYKGSFKNQFPCGEGTWVLKKGVEIKGCYNQIERREETQRFPKVKSEYYNEVSPAIDLDWV